jgi:hypothetical protein
LEQSKSPPLTELKVFLKKVSQNKKIKKKGI